MKASKTFLFKHFVCVLLFGLLIDAVILTQSWKRIEIDQGAIAGFPIVEFFGIILASLSLSFSLSTTPQQIVFAFFWIFQKIFFGYVPFLNSIDEYPYYLSQIVETRFEVLGIYLTLTSEIIIISIQILAWKFRLFESSDRNPKIFQHARLIGRIEKTLIAYLIALPFLVQQLGGFSYLFRKVRYLNISQSSPISILAVFESFFLIPPLICLVVLLNLRFYGFKARLPRFIFPLTIWVFLMSNPLGNARQTTLFLISPILYLVFRKHRFITYSFFCVLPLVLIYFSNLVDRYTGRIGMPKLIVVSRHGDFDAFMQLANGIEKVATGHFPVLQQIQSILFFFIPRSYWQGKPLDTGVELARLHGLSYQNLSAPWILEAYVNARSIGVVLVSIALALLFTRVDIRANCDQRAGVYASIISGLMFITLRGSLLQATGRAVFSFIFILWLFRGMSKNNELEK